MLRSPHWLSIPRWFWNASRIPQDLSTAAWDDSVECPKAPAIPGDRRTDRSQLRVISVGWAR